MLYTVLLGCFLLVYVEYILICSESNGNVVSEENSEVYITPRTTISTRDISIRPTRTIITSTIAPPKPTPVELTFNSFPPTPTETIPSTSSEASCILPSYPYNKYEQRGCPGCTQKAGDTVNNNGLIVVTCARESQLSHTSSNYKSMFIICNNGIWEPEVPQCHKLCRPLTSRTLNLECWQGPTQVSCDQDMLPNTKVTYTCKQFYKLSESGPNGLKCLRSGNWSGDLPTCSPICGQSDPVVVEATIVNGTVTKQGNFPWHAGLYHKSKDEWNLACGGTLISPEAVLTAAHCVTSRYLRGKPTKMEPNDIMVALGKNNRNLLPPETDQVQTKVKYIHVHQNYMGEPQNFDKDIAVLILETPVTVNKFVMPACVDYAKLLNVSRLMKEQKAYVVGWGNTNECLRGSVCDPPSDHLLFARTKVMDYDTCFSETQSLKLIMLGQSQLTLDKYCAIGDGAASVVQPGDSGGGLTFSSYGIHYVFGIVSVKIKVPKGSSGTTFYNFGAFTSVPTYLNWLKSNLL